MTNSAVQAERIATNGIFMKTITYHNGGPNLLATAAPVSTYKTWIPASMSAPDQMRYWGRNIAQYREHRENHEGWNLRQPGIDLAPRFTHSVPLVAVTENSKGPVPYNPFQFARPWYLYNSSTRG